MSKKHRYSVHGGFTLIELLVVVAVIGILAALLFPAFVRARENARRSSCASNLKQIGIGLLQYVQDYDEYFPPYFAASAYIKPDGSTIPSSVDFGGFKDLIDPYIKNVNVFACPSDWGSQDDPTPFYTQDSWNKTSTLFNGSISTAGGDNGVAGHNLASITDSSLVVTVAEAAALKPFSWHMREGSQAYYSGARSNVGFVDGHVKFIKIYRLDTYNAVKHNPPAGYEYRWSAQ